MMAMYKLRYLPLAEKDLESIADYIANHLKAPKAALDFINAVENGVKQLLEHPYSCRVYQPERPIDMEYRLLVVNNFLIFYVVLENFVEIHRIVYGRRNIADIFR